MIRDATGNVLHAVRLERERQERLKEQGKFAFTCSDAGISDSERFTVLGEELGEVGHEVNEAIGHPALRNRTALRAELIQVAAVAVAWCEALDKEGPCL